LTSKLKPLKASHDTGQRIPCLTGVNWPQHGFPISKKDVINYIINQRLHASVSWSMAAIQGKSFVVVVVDGYAPTSNTATRDNQEKINSWVSFFSYTRMGLHLLALRTPGAPLLISWRGNRCKPFLNLTNRKCYTTYMKIQL